MAPRHLPRGASRAPGDARRGETVVTWQRGGPAKCGGDRARAARLMDACPDGEAFRGEAIGLLRRAVGFDGWCWARVDPHTRLPAHGSLAEDVGADAMLPRLFRAVCRRDRPSPA